MDSVFCGADAGFCRSIQNPAKRVETGCWTARRGFWILPQHPESRKTRGNCILDDPARILDSAAASRIPQNAWILDAGRPGSDSGFCAASRTPQKAWKLDAGRPGADSGFCRKIQLPESNIHAQRMCSMLLVHMHMRACMRTCICARCQSKRAADSGNWILRAATRSALQPRRRPRAAVPSQHAREPRVRDHHCHRMSS